MKAGESVRLKGNPGRIGIFTGQVRKRGNRELLQVRFPDTTTYEPGDHLEPLPAENENPLDLPEQGRIGTAGDLRRILAHVRLSGKLANA